jgi:fatty-acyl-CoA synthase
MSVFTEGIDRTAATTSHRLHYGATDDMRSAPWSEVVATGRRATAALRAAGVCEGDRLAVLAAHANDVAPVAYGTWGAGAAMTMLQQPNPQADLREWHAATLRSLDMLGARTVVVGEPFLTVAESLRAAGYEAVSIPAAWPDATAPLVRPAEHDVALYQLTSGSTGDPKAVAITHANLFANAEAMRVGAVAEDTDVMLSWLPLSHDMGLVGFLLTPLHLGLETVYVAPTEFLRSPLNWMRLISDYGATITAAPNFAYSIVHRRLKAANEGVYDLSRLRFALCGAEPIDPNTMDEFVRQATRFGMRADAVVAAYGLAEATLAVSFARVGEGLRVERLDAEDFERRRRAVLAARTDPGAKEVVVLGPPLPGMAVRVRAEGGDTDLPARHLGELQIRGGAVTRRYATVGGGVDATDAEGWLHTGDLGYLTDDGEVVVCGRLKNVIIVAGRNIFPCELERIAESADGVRRGAVVAFGTVLPDRRETITVVAETAETCDADTRREMQRQIARKVYGVIGLSPHVVLVDRGTIPKTPSGKIRHVAAKQMFAGAR